MSAKVSSPVLRGGRCGNVSHLTRPRVVRRLTSKKKKKEKLTDYTYTQVIPVLTVSDQEQLISVADRQGQCRAATYNKLGSLQGWGLHWKGADKIVRGLCPPQDELPGKLREWAVNDCFKAISAQQEAAKVFIRREIWRRYPITSQEKARKQWYTEQVELLGKKNTLLRPG